MKLTNVLSASAMLLVVLVSGCSKDLGSSDISSDSATLSASAEKKGAVNTSGSTIKAVNLGVAGDFVILSKQPFLICKQHILMQPDVQTLIF